ncbi:uncharacterized protein [Littorina saxatilis]|uniref:beta-N-acetylhexosaminidase n=2 Tax=Littorina saxatilis TaxID=31220 RepID=A0AAN9BZY2_9CAEN
MMTLECRLALLLALLAFLCTTVSTDLARRVAYEVKGARAGREPAHLPFSNVPDIQGQQQPLARAKNLQGSRNNQDNQQPQQNLNQQPQKVHVINQEQDRQQQAAVNAQPVNAGQQQNMGDSRRDNARQQAQVEAQNQQRDSERRAALQAAFQQQEQRRQQQQERVQQQQESIRKQVEQQKQYHQQVLQQQQSQQKQQADALNSNNNINNNVNSNNDGGANSNNNLNSDINAHKQNSPVEPPKRSEIIAPTPRPIKEDVGGAGSVVGNAQGSNNQDAQGSNNRDVPGNPNSDNAQKNEQGDVPDAPHQPVNNNGLSDEFRRGLMKKVQGEEASNLNNIPIQRNAFPPEQPVREIGGMHINWDWDDFSITFQNYGAAEMKVRRAPHATTGEPWPLPQYYTKKDKNILVVDSNFQFVVTSNISCDIIDQAVERFRRRIVEDAMEDMYDNLQNAEGSNLEPPEPKYKSIMFSRAPIIGKISLKVRKPCTVFPSLDSDESYDLVVKKSSTYLWANEVWGLLRGLETLSQLVWRGADDRLYVKESVISDYPRFPHRGILLDSSRHFIFKEVIFEMMDAMEMNKMNVLHWHIVDDQSFPYQSQVFPELSAKGAYHPTFVYSLGDIADMIEYARMRGIRVLPEFDSPGHTYSWGLSRPELLTQCYSGSSPVKGYLGPIDPVHNSSYRFLKTLFGEILNVFKDEYMHLGGDEVPLGCWQSNPDVTKFGEKLSQQGGQSQNNQQAYFGGPSPNIRLVYEYYVNRVMKDIKELGKKRDGIKFIMWQEVMNNDLKLPNDTLIQVWMGDMADVSRAIGMGYNVLYSSCWYLDHVEYGVKWPKYYQCDPADTSYGYQIDEKKVKGGEACLWSEYIDNENLVQTTWPRASAVAERLWSSKDTRNLDTAGERLSEHRCRMLRRGLSVGQVSGPDYCLKRGVKRGPRRGPDCQGEGCRAPPVNHSPVEDPGINFHLRTESGSKSSDCSWLFQVGGNVTLLAIVAVIAFVVLVSMRSSGKLYTLRTCRHRTILIVFFTVLIVYFMCYTTMWMHVFEFSGSLHKRRHGAASSSSPA